MPLNHLLRAIASQPWAMSQQGLDTMIGVLSYRMRNGGPLSAEQVEARLNGRQERNVRESAGNIAVIPIRGVISNRINMLADVSQMGTSAEKIERDIRAAYADEAIKAIVIDMDTPGGSAAGTPELGDTLRSMRGGKKPIITQVNALSASAGYWIASNTDEIVAVPSAQIGSIGVITIHKQIAQMMENEGIVATIIASSKYKAEGNPYEPLSEEALQHLTDMVNQYDDMFIKAVAEGRGTSTARVRGDFGQGRTLLAAEAKKLGMIDRVGTMRETLERLGATYTDSPRNRASSPQRSLSVQRKRLELEAANG